MHFINDLLDKPKDPDPIKNLPQVHKHFYRFSRGKFEGPYARIKFSSTKVYVDASFEYEYVLAWLAMKALPEDFDEEFKITGSIVGGSDFTEKLHEIGLNWEVDKSTGKTKNYKCKITPSDEVMVKKQHIIDLVENLSTSCYILLSFKAGPNNKYTLTTKKKPPQPGKGDKKDKDEARKKRRKFSKLRMPNTDSNREIVLNELIPDFLDEVPEDSKMIKVINIYDIDNLELPPRDKVKNSKLIRILALREGIFTRKVVVDDEEFSYEVKFSV